MRLEYSDYQHACKIAAKLVSKFGDVYLPIFERTLKELKKVKKQTDLKSVAMRLALE